MRKGHSTLCRFLSRAFFCSHFCSLNIISVISIISVQIPVTSDSIKLCSFDSSITYLPSEYPVKKPINVSVINPNPNAITKLYSSFAFIRSYWSLFEKPSTCSVILLYLRRSTLSLISSRFFLFAFSLADLCSSLSGFYSFSLPSDFYEASWYLIISSREPIVISWPDLGWGLVMPYFRFWLQMWDDAKTGSDYCEMSSIFKTLYSAIDFRSTSSAVISYLDSGLMPLALYRSCLVCKAYFWASVKLAISLGKISASSLSFYSSSLTLHLI